MNRRSMLQVCAGVLALGFGVRAVAQVPGYPGCKKRLHSTKCPRCNSDWTFKVTMEGVCPKGDDDAC